MAQPSRLPRVPLLPWIALTFLGALGVIVTSLILHTRLPQRFMTGPDSMVLQALVLGGVVGFLQWIVLRRYVKDAASWIVWVVAASLLGLGTSAALWQHNEAFAVVAAGTVVFAVQWLVLRRRVGNAVSLLIGTLACGGFCLALPFLLFVFFYPG